MATTTNYAWETPDDTDLVKDGAAAIRTLGSSIDTTTKALNPSTTLGDIEYRSSTANTNTRLGIGSTGQVLTVSGGVPTWAAVAGSTLNLSQVATGSMSGSSVSFSSLSSYDTIVIAITGVTWNTANSDVRIRLNGSTGAIYNALGSAVINGGSTFKYENIGSDGFTSNNNQTFNNSSNVRILTFTNCKAAGFTTLNYNASYNNVTPSMEVMNYQGWFAQAAAVSSIAITTTGGYSFNGGTYYVIAG